MKKLFVLIAFVCCVSAQAATWVPVTGVTGKKSAIDTSSLIYNDSTYTIRSAWVKIFQPQNEYSVVRVFIHCPTRMYYTGAYNTFSQDGFLLMSENTPTIWEYSVPNSIAEIWGNIICTTPIKNR